jgi:hypothetical protein
MFGYPVYIAENPVAPPPPLAVAEDVTVKHPASWFVNNLHGAWSQRLDQWSTRHETAINTFINTFGEEDDDRLLIDADLLTSPMAMAWQAFFDEVPGLVPLARAIQLEEGYDFAAGNWSRLIVLVYLRGWDWRRAEGSGANDDDHHCRTLLAAWFARTNVELGHPGRNRGDLEGGALNLSFVATERDSVRRPFGLLAWLGRIDEAALRIRANAPGGSDVNAPVQGRSEHEQYEILTDLDNRRMAALEACEDAVQHCKGLGADIALLDTEADRDPSRRLTVFALRRSLEDAVAVADIQRSLYDAYEFMLSVALVDVPRTLVNFQNGDIGARSLVDTVRLKRRVPARAIGDAESETSEAAATDQLNEAAALDYDGASIVSSPDGDSDADGASSGGSDSGILDLD